MACIAGWFSRDWLLQKADDVIIASLNDRGVYISYDKFESDFLRGLVLTEIMLWKDAERTVPLIKLGDVAFRPGLTRLLTERSVTGRLSIRDSELELYSDGKSVASFDNLDLSANLKSRGMIVNQLDGELYGMDFKSNGFMLISKRADEEPPTEGREGESDENDETGEAGEEKKWFDFAHLAAVAKWAAFESKNERPQLDVKFNIDRSAPDPVVVDVQLSGKDITWHGVPFESVDAAAQYSEAGKSVDVSHLKIGHGGGELEGDAHYAIAQRTLKIGRLRSTLNPFAFAEDLPFDIADRLDVVSIKEKHPEIVFGGTLDFADFGKSVFQAEVPMPVSLTLNLEEGASVPLKNVHGTVSFDKGTIGATDLAVTLYGLDVNANGQVKLRARKSANEMVAEAPSAIVEGSAPEAEAENDIVSDAEKVDVEEIEGADLASTTKKEKKPLRPLLAKVFSSIKKWTTFSSDAAHPRLDAKFAVDTSAADPVVVDGNLTGEKFTWQGARFDSMAAAIIYSQARKMVAVPAFEFSYYHELIKGGLEYHVTPKVLDLHGVECQADWISLCAHLPFGLEERLSAIGLPDPPDLVADGKIVVGDFAASDFTLASLREVPISVRIGHNLIEIDAFSGTAHIADGAINSEDLRMNLGGGDLAWQGAYFPATRGYDGTLKVENLPLAELLKLAGKEAMEGIVNGTVTGAGDREVVMRQGSGNIVLNETESLKIPVIGGLLKFLATVAPVLGTTKDEIVTLSFVTEDGVMKTDDLQAKGAGVEVDVEGQVDWTAMDTSFVAEAKLGGAVGVITALASKALKIEGSGPLNDIDWKFKNADIGLLGDAAEGVIGVGGDAVMKVGEGAGERVKKIGEGAEEGVKRITEGLMKIIPGGTRKKDEEPKPEEARPETQ